MSMSFVVSPKRGTIKKKKKVNLQTEKTGVGNGAKTIGNDGGKQKISKAFL